MTQDNLSEISLGLCHCGCGQRTKIADRNDRWADQVKGQPLRFIVGHNAKRPRILPDLTCLFCGASFRPKRRTQRFCSKPCAGRMKTMPSGRDHPRYKGGWFYSQGRLMVTCRDGTQTAWYRIVMWNELGRPVAHDEVVHHINSDHADDRPENLKVMSQQEHIQLHRDELVAARWSDTEALAAG